MSSTLIISKLSEEKKLDDQQVFLDRACCENYLNLRANDIVADPYGITEKMIRQDTANTYKIYKVLLNELTEILNEYHYEKCGSRFWEILLGPWLYLYINISYNKKKSIEKAIIDHNITKIKIGNFKNYNFTTKETGGYFESILNPEWDLMFKSRIAYTFKNLPIKLETSDFNQNFISNYNHYEVFKKNNKKKYFISNILEKLNIFNIKSEIILDETYFGLKNEIFYQILLRQYPYVFKPIKVKYPNKDIKIREDLKKKLLQENDPLKDMIKDFIFEDMPIVFLEGFGLLQKIKNLKSLPYEPKVIFTSNSFFLNETFKFYTALNLAKSKYLVGQHGNGYGTHTSHNYLPEYSSCDYFISWGHKDRNKDIPLFNFKTKDKNYDLKGKDKILIVNRTLGDPSTTWDKTHHYTKHFKNRNFFIKNLNSDIQKKIIFRLHQAYTRRFPNEAEIVRNELKNIKIDEGRIHIKHLMKQSKLVIYTYYSTGFLELISFDTPILCLEEDLLKKVRKKYKKIFLEMIDNKIIFTNFDDLTTFFSKEYLTIDEWWKSSKISNLRSKFYNIFCKKPDKKELNLFLKFINNLANNIVKL